MDTSDDVKRMLHMATEADRLAAEHQSFGRESRMRYYRGRASLFRCAAMALRICGTAPKQATK